jgi:pimeloyl-ACP methyl ester carboxylesterase
MRRRQLLLGISSAALAGCLSFHRGPMPGEPKGATFATVRGTRVHYVDEGKGPPVVLVHGFASSLNAWNGVRQALVAKGHRVIALDLRGFGWTDRPEGDYSPKAQAELVFGLLDERGVEGPVAVVAHSWGSSIALQMAIRKPERVSRLALYDAWIYEDQIPLAFLLARAGGVGEALIGAFYGERPDDKIAIAFHDPRFVTEELVETVEDQLSRPGTHAAALAAIRGQRYEEIERLYGDVDKPVLLLWGREDRVTPLEVGERLVKDLPDAKLVVYPQCGHFPMIEARKPSTRDLIEFLAPERAAPPPPPPPSTPTPTPPPPSTPTPTPPPPPTPTSTPTSTSSAAPEETP